MLSTSSGRGACPTHDVSITAADINHLHGGRSNMAVLRLRTMPPGTRVSERYPVVRYLCSGGMGDVYEVEHTLLGRHFALKRLAADKVGKARHVERFLCEARAAAATGHPGVVEVVDLGFAEDGWPFLVMERL